MQSPREATVAVTLGDPAGVGAEVALRAVLALLRPSGAAASRGVRALPRVLLLGDPDAAREAALRLRLPLEVVRCGREEAGAASRRPARGRLVLQILAPDADLAPPLRARERRPGKPSVAGARLAYASIVLAVELAREGVVDALCTAPINKGWFDRAGVASTGHTEILAALTGSRHVRLMMAHRELRVVLATSHLALRDVPSALTADGVLDTIRIADRHLRRWFGLARPRIAVAALNPHASDGGVYGDEEERVLAPAIRRARASRVDAIGPVPADTLFSAVGPRCDAVVAMYHDQGLIPVKQRDVHEAVNVTLGLPFVRTSPDHGTAYDLAGTGRADPRSMRAALGLALHLARIERATRGSSSPRRSAPAA
jgi:4-hydroxythreonine-4-phosphate dehydrogenase